MAAFQLIRANVQALDLAKVIRGGLHPVVMGYSNLSMQSPLAMATPSL